jgi:hypothetical protein
MHEPLEACAVAWVGVLQRISLELYTELKKAEFWRPEVLDAITDLDADGLLGHLEEVLAREVTEEEVVFFGRMVQEAVEAERFANIKRRRTLSNMNHPELGIEVLPKTAVLTERELLLAKVPIKVKAGTEFPVASSRKVVGKEGVRLKLVDEVTAALIEAGMPTATLFATSTDPSRLFVRLGAGKRVSTLKQKLAVFRKMRKYMLAVHGIPFPTLPIQLMDYIMDRADEPCGVTVPGSILATVRFFEEMLLQAMKDQAPDEETSSSEIDDDEVLDSAEIDEANPNKPKSDCVCQDCVKGSSDSSEESSSETDHEAGSDSSSGAD